jgi:hypothetical protein
MLLATADELDSWADVLTSEAAATEDRAEGVDRQPMAALYNTVLVAARAREVDHETAAIASAIALDANRISDQLKTEPEPPAPARFGWRSLFGP